MTDAREGQSSADTEGRTKWYAYCDVRKPPHALSGGAYLPWTGDRRNTVAEARQDATVHNQNAGHNATVLSAP
jgi:hypothetical protein